MKQTFISKEQQQYLSTMKKAMNDMRKDLTKEKAREFLLSAKIIDKSGRLAKQYR